MLFKENIQGALLHYGKQEQRVDQSRSAMRGILSGVLSWNHDYHWGSEKTQEPLTKEAGTSLSPVLGAFLVP